jgi:hypothetical protein
MKKKLFWLSVIISLFAFSFSSCDENEPENSYLPTKNLTDSLLAAYPQATDVKWKLEKGYAFAEFDSVKVWLDLNGNIKKTETEISYSALPQQIKDSLTAYGYSSTNGYICNEIEFITQIGLLDKYEIEFIKNGTEYELLLSGSGQIVNVKIDDEEEDDDIIEAPKALLDSIAVKFPLAQIYEIDSEDNLYEIELLYNNQELEVYYSLNYMWQCTKTEIDFDSLPAIVKDAFNASIFATYSVSKTESIQTINDTQYNIEVYSGRLEFELLYNSSGQLLSVNQD